MWLKNSENELCLEFSDIQNLKSIPTCQTNARGGEALTVSFLIGALSLQLNIKG